MVLTSSRIFSCEVWLMLIRKTSAPASNSLRIIALSEEAGPSVARILMRRCRLMLARLIASFRASEPAAGPQVLVWRGSAAPGNPHRAHPEAARRGPGGPAVWAVARW